MKKRLKTTHKKKRKQETAALSKFLSAATLGIMVALIIIIAFLAADTTLTSAPFGESTTAEETTEATTEATTTTEPATTEPSTVFPEEGYTSVNEKVYTTEELNVRTGPDTDFDKIGSLAKGTEVNRVAIGENGWSKIIFHGEICYVSSKYLTAEKPEEETTSEREDEPIKSERIIIDPTQEAWNLVVVNSGREIPSGYTPKLAEVADTGVYLDYRVAPHYTEMYYAAKDDGITLVPYSGYRSYSRQERNYNNRINNNIANGMTKEEAIAEASSVILPPGTSEHNLGLAMDICNTKNSFKDQKEYAWLMENAHKYGFILRYTAEKQPITGIVPEPWHWRYVGIEYAEAIKNSGLCLEEYLDSVGIPY